MMRRVTGICLSLILAFGILVISVFRTAEVRYVFSQSSTNTSPTKQMEEIKIDYVFPFPGRVLADSPLWPIKVLRDKFWILVTTNSLKKAQLKLLLADKRLASSKILLARKKYDLAMSSLTKGEKYLEEAVLEEEKARKMGVDTKSFLMTLSKAILAHRLQLEEILLKAPKDAKPLVVSTMDYPKRLFSRVRDVMISLGLIPIKDPFEDK